MSLRLHVSGYTHTGEDGKDVLYSHRGSCICLIETPHDDTAHVTLDTLIEECSNVRFEHLIEFERFIVYGLQRSGLTEVSSMACIYQHGDILFIKTMGAGAVYLHRGTRTARIVHGNSSASGHIAEGDCVIATTQSLIDALGSQDVLFTEFLTNDIHENTRLLKERLEGQQSSSGICYATWLARNPEQEHAVRQEEPLAATSVSETKNSVMDAFRDLWARKKGSMTKKRTITLGILAVILAVFIWSVVLGYYRHQRSQTDKKISAAQELITQKLLQAEEVSVLNSARAQALLIDARNDLKQLLSSVKDSADPRISDLEKRIVSMESRVLKKEEKAYTEYYDLTVDSKNARGTRMAYSEGDVAILNKQSGEVYLLSLEKKSLEKLTAPEVSGAVDVAVFDRTAYIIRSDGIYRLEDGGIARKVIPRGGEWGAITDAELFNGNVYILDGPRNDIYKYVVADEDKFASSGSYFRSSAPPVSSPVSCAIDGSVYILYGGSVFKYTSGLRDGFAPRFPTENLAFHKVLTQEDGGKIYIWDKQHSVIYIVNKEGGYERQIQSPILKAADDIAVHETNAYILMGSKIYAIGLN